MQICKGKGLSLCFHVSDDFIICSDIVHTGFWFSLVDAITKSCEWPILQINRNSPELKILNSATPRPLHQLWARQSRRLKSQQQEPHYTFRGHKIICYLYKLCLLICTLKEKPTNCLHPHILPARGDHFSCALTIQSHSTIQDRLIWYQLRVLISK